MAVIERRLGALLVQHRAVSARCRAATQDGIGIAALGELSADRSGRVAEEWRSEGVEASLKDSAYELDGYGKGGRRRVVPVGAEVIEAVDAYLNSRKHRLGSFSPTDRLFVRGDGRPFSRGTLDYLVSTWFRRAGVAPPPGSLAHALRHTYATLLVDNGASLPEVQRLLGHRDLSTTQVYLEVTGSGLEQTALANPARALLRQPSHGVRHDPSR